MSMTLASGRCRNCNDEAMVVCQAPRHGLHFVLSILTAGLWLPAWLIIAMVGYRCICCQCGRSVSAADVTTQAGTDTWYRPWGDLGSGAGSGNFNMLLVARNLVYYVPTLAAYERR